jgi:hypothetical protein
VHNPVGVALVEPDFQTVTPGASRPALAVVLTGEDLDGPRMGCGLLEISSTLITQKARWPLLPAAPEDARWGVRIATDSGTAAALAWWYSPIEARGRIFVNRLDLATPPMTAGEWSEAGTLQSDAGPEILMARDGSTLVLRPMADATGWEAVPVSREGLPGVAWLVSSRPSAVMRATTRPGGFLTFQPQPGGVGGGEVHIVELDPEGQPGLAWQWVNLPLPGPSLTVRAVGEAVTLLSASVQALWRPVRIESIAWRPTQPSAHVFVSGPAGSPGRIRHGENLGNLTNTAFLTLEGPASLAPRAGAAEFIWQATGDPSSRYFVFESPVLRPASP